MKKKRKKRNKTRRSEKPRKTKKKKGTKILEKSGKHRSRGRRYGRRMAVEQERNGIESF